MFYDVQGFTVPCLCNPPFRTIDMEGLEMVGNGDLRLTIYVIFNIYKSFIRMECLAANQML